MPLSSNPNPPARPIRWKLISIIVTAALIVLVFLAEFNLQDMQITGLTDSGKAEQVAISPDGSYVVYALVDGERQSLWIRNVATKSDVQVLPPAAVVFNGLSFSPDGNRIYSNRTGYPHRHPATGYSSHRS